MDYTYNFQDTFATAGSAGITPSPPYPEHFAPQTPQRQQPVSSYRTPFFSQAQQQPFCDLNLSLSQADVCQTMFSTSPYQMSPAERVGGMTAAQRHTFSAQPNAPNNQPNQPRQVQQASLPSSTPSPNTMAMHSPFALNAQRAGARQQVQSPSPYPTPPQSGNSLYGQRAIANLTPTRNQVPSPAPALTFGPRAGAPRQNPNISHGTLDTAFVDNNSVSSSNMATPHMATHRMATTPSSAGDFWPDEPFAEKHAQILMKQLHDRKKRGEVPATQILAHLYASGNKAEFEARIKEVYYTGHRRTARTTPAAKQARIAELQNMQVKANAQRQKNAQAQAAQQQKEAHARDVQQQLQRESHARAIHQQKEAEARAEQELQARRQKEAQERRIKQQQEHIRAAKAEEERKKQAAIAERNRKRKAQEHQQRLAEEAEWYRIAQAQKLERERKLIRKEQLRKDPSALFRHYNEYLSYFPLEYDQRRSNYHNNLLSNRTMTAEADTDLNLAIQFAKDHWEWFLVFPKDEKKATAWQKEKLAAEAALRQPTMAASCKAKGK
jgi:hypothetical protein